jgi:hypothetical protein
VNAIPLHTARLVEKLLTSYCQRVCPPSARHAVQLRFALGHDRVTVSEVRRFCGVPGADLIVPLAEFRYARRTGDWQLLHAAGVPATSTPRWRRYPTVNRSRNFLELLRAFDADPAGRFWSRLNGRSVRWCSSTGRCEGCDHRYGRILGLGGARSARIEVPVTRLPVPGRSSFMGSTS